MYVLLPGESVWEKFYLSYKNNQIRFSRKIKGSYKFSYAITNVVVRMITKYISLESEKKLRKIFCLMLTHRYDKLPIFLTVPLFYEMSDLSGQSKKVVDVLHKVKEKIEELARELNPYADETNNRSWGKIKCTVGSLQNFPYKGGNIFVKISLTPWQFKTKRILDQKFDFNQTMFIPVANNWFSIRIELMNFQTEGWLIENKIEKCLVSYDIRICDLHKPPFGPDGWIKLPVPKFADSKKMGLTPIEEMI